MELFHGTILKLEGNNVSSLDVFQILNVFKEKIEHRIEHCYFRDKIHEEFLKLNTIEICKIEDDFKGFYLSTLKYITKRFDFSDNNLYAKLAKFSSTSNFYPSFIDFKDLITLFNLKEKLRLNMDALFEEVITFTKFINNFAEREDFKKLKCSSNIWYKIFISCEVKLVNIFKVIAFFASIPGTSSFVKEYLA